MNAHVKSPIVNVHEAKTNLSKLLDRVHSGEEIILAKAGKPWAKLVPIEREPTSPLPKSPRRSGRFAHLLGLIDNEALLAPIDWSKDENEDGGRAQKR